MMARSFISKPVMYKEQTGTINNVEVERHFCVLRNQGKYVNTKLLCCFSADFFHSRKATLIDTQCGCVFLECSTSTAREEKLGMKKRRYGKSHLGLAQNTG